MLFSIETPICFSLYKKKVTVTLLNDESIEPIAVGGRDRRQRRQNPQREPIVCLSSRQITHGHRPSTTEQQTF
ncbi:hypothetical protein HanRHA438_Chr07g0300301 [Helianthus annuus]|nr:hypothetical protein HanRHA438_Chr07g0300301 [Helianthus annuus]